MRSALLSVLLCSASASAEPGAALLERLRQGGHVLFLRHTSAAANPDDSRLTRFEDCATQRNLTDRGREEARALGEHLKRLKIPVGEVFASPFCRTLETAGLAFGKAWAADDLRGGIDPGRSERLRRRLSETVPQGRNRVLSSHADTFHLLFGPPALAEGEIAVIRPGRNPSVIARIRLTEW